MNINIKSWSSLLFQNNKQIICPLASGTHGKAENLLCDIQLHRYMFILQNEKTNRRRDRTGKPEIKN